MNQITGTIDGPKALAQGTIKVTIKGQRSMKWRVSLAKLAFSIGAWVMGTKAKCEVVYESELGGDDMTFKKGDLVWLERDNYAVKGVILEFYPDKVDTQTAEYRLKVQPSKRAAWYETYSKKASLHARERIPIPYKRHWAYLKAVLRHKRFVFQECLKSGVPIWIAVLHDWDKFLPDEWLPYARCFYKSDGTKQYKETPAFNKAWNHHQKRNKHHYQYWILTMDSGAVIPLPMPDVFRREMLADWRGAGRAYGNSDTKGWYLQRQAMFAEKLHPETKAWVEQQLGVSE